jgi:hypothetical protein
MSDYYFKFDIGTQEMADTIETVKPHVDGTTAAVVAMQEAVIVAEQQAADSICDNVNRGFYTLIRSQISQKIAAIRSQLDARMLELRDQARKMYERKRVMEHDFQMIASRNMKLFAMLDAALFNRVHELDQPAVDLTRKDLQKIYQRYGNSQASLPVHQLESICSAQVIASSSAKADAMRTIEAMDRFIASSALQNRLTLSILGRGTSNAAATLSLPFAVAEMDGSEGGHRLWRQFVPARSPQKLARAAEQAIRAALYSATAGTVWKPVAAGERQRVEEQYRARVARATASDRVKQQMIRLFAASAWLQPEKERA